MKIKLLTLSTLVAIAFCANAQNVGIGTSSPNTSAKLDVSASDKGILFPNVALTSTNDASTIATPATGLIVWNTGSGGLSPAGFYYNAGTSGSPNWTKVANGAVLTNTLTDGRILIGNGSNIATEQTMSGDVTIANTGATTISNNAVTTAKIADNAVTGAKIDISGNSNGSLMYYNGTDWVNLAPGTSGQVLRTNGAGAPTWSNGNDIFTFENGLTETSPNIVRLGGALTQPTTISSLTATNKMSFTGAGVDAFNVDGTTFSVDATNDRVGIGTASPSYKLDVVGDVKMTGNTIINNASPTLFLQDNDHRSGMIHVNSNLMYFLNGTGTGSLSWGTVGSFWPLYIDLTNDDLVFGGRGLFMEGNVGIGTAAPAVKLAVGGDGTDVYQTDLWVERNIHVRGNEDLTQIAGTQYGRLRVGSAWGYNGLYTDGASDGSGNDLVLGASSGLVRIGPNAGGQNLKVSGLEGTGNRNVYADANGVLTTSQGNSINMYRFVNSTSVAIPDNNTQTNSNITVSGVLGNIIHLEVIIYITHTYDADLDIFLSNSTSGGTVTELSTDNGGSGDNYLFTKFTDDAPNCITAGSAAFDFGTYRPENSGTCQRGFRSNYYGSNPNGTWQLRVWDDAGGDSGTIQSWELRFWTQ